MNIRNIIVGVGIGILAMVITLWVIGNFTQTASTRAVSAPTGATLPISEPTGKTYNPQQTVNGKTLQGSEL